MGHAVTGIDGPAIEAGIADWYNEAGDRSGLHLWLSNHDQDVVIPFHTVIFSVLLLLFGCCGRLAGGGECSFWVSLLSAIVIFVGNYALYFPGTLAFAQDQISTTVTLWFAVLTFLLQNTYNSRGGFASWLLLVGSGMGLALQASRNDVRNPIGGAVLVAWPLIAGIQHLSVLVGSGYHEKALEQRLKWVEDQNDSLVRAMERKEALINNMESRSYAQE